ncbi:TIM-barrel domain-containing protein [Mucilaginibacter paludis]|uniref:Glycoside hydrolase family 31 n=1 Tax=Mucilaginibacter paludis DSM 18603 TaxID=714943 RepID=H1YE14_9SPHI|nr:TIM-barrel domain-containing protein [Mucilaginibacter paludis]EHQ25192.1 glycoside hydrolase family 31 [Mucilaginibacter paludis DSM 18603]
MSYGFVNVNAFTPNTSGWTTIGNISKYTQTGNVFTLQLQRDATLSLQISVLSPSTFRVRFNPSANFNYTIETSPAVINRSIAPVTVNTSKSTANMLVIDTGTIQICVALNPYLIQVFKNGQLINQDTSGQNLVYIPGQRVIANFKATPQNAKYCGFGEKAGSTLLKNNYTMTFFNFDNYSYSSGIIPAGNSGGPLNPSEPLYCSVPLLLEINPAPQGAYAGSPYAYGIFFDNTSQSYFNVGSNDYSDMTGKYYFGALYGDMDYYFMYGDQVTGVLKQYTTLTGRSAMPPKYVFGYHQGGYGYFNSSILAVVANSYRAANIPIDGLHIDVDFQDNYRTFTSSKMKFPNVSNFMDYLHSIGFKCSTNITPLMTANPLDENGEASVYQQRKNMMDVNGSNGLIYNTRAGQGESPNLYAGTVSYGMNLGNNPYPAPPLQPNNQGQIPLQATGNYADFSREDVRKKWGDQYIHLINEVGMDMIWQDMTDPAIANPPASTFPLDLMQSNGITYVPHATIHNEYALNLVNATYSGLQRLSPEKRPFIIARGGYAGMQRYAALWTGDSASSWDFLQINIPEVLNIGLSGIPISGCDIGGFAVSNDPNGTTSGFYVSYGKVYGGITNYELFTRWIQLGAFLPWFRNHYNGYNKQFQEIYAYGEPVPTNCRKYIQLRYRLIQLFYDAMYEWTLNGTPIARALFINDGHDPNVYNHLNDQFFVGKDMLVAPILTQHESLPNPTPPYRQVYLPAGCNWYAFMNNQYPLSAPVPGGTTINYYADLTLVPIYIREGAIIPTRELEQYVGQLPVNPLTINIYPGKDDSYHLYLDDGTTTNAEKNGQFRYVEIAHHTANNTRSVTLTRITDNYQPAEPYYFIALLQTGKPSAVNIQNKVLPQLSTPGQLASAPVNSYYWNASIQITFIKVFDNASSLVINATF